MKRKNINDDLKTKTVPWTNDVVYSVYCNDNLEELPIGILNRMRDYMSEVIDSKFDKDLSDYHKKATI